MSTIDEKAQLELLGYDQSFEVSRLELGVDMDCLARITAEHKGAYEVVCLDGEYRATVSGKFMLAASRREDYPAVGDWVVTRDGDEDSKVIEGILERHTLLRKKYAGKNEAQLIAANVEVAFVVESMDRDYSVNRFERYVVLARQGGVQPVIILNKSDLLTDIELSARIEQLRERFPGIDILHTSTLTHEGLDSLSEYIRKGITYCFLGSSGVGKSSLINRLLDQNRIETKEIGAKTGRGRHTTTSREMYFMSKSGIIIDNPGSRGVGIVDFAVASKEVFVDIEKISQKCRFKDCKHRNELGCAVVGSITSGDINAEQYDNYVKLQKETEHYEMNSHDKRQKDKQFGKFVKNAKNDLRKYSPKY